MEITEKENEEKEEEKKKEVKEKKEEEKEEEKKKEEVKKEKQQTNSVSLEPQRQIGPEPSEEQKLQRVQDLEVIEGPTAAHRRVRRPRIARRDIPGPSEEELLEFEEDLREFIALRAACKTLQPKAVQTFRRPRSLQENLHYLYLRQIISDIERYELKYCPKSVSETSSTASSVSVRSDSSKYEPPSFNPERKQSQLTEEISSCSVCEEAVKDPVRLLCGHRSCKQCVHSFKDKNGADCSCKACGRRFKGEPEHQTDSEDDKKNLNLPSASRPAPQNTTGPAGREKTDQDLQSVLLEKTIKRVEMETEKLQAEKGSFQAEKEKFDAEKETFQAEKEKFQAEKEKSLAEKEKFELEKRKLALEIQSLEQKGSYNPYVPYSFPRNLKLV